jgi:hypothetical protein
MDRDHDNTGLKRALTTRPNHHLMLIRQEKKDALSNLTLQSKNNLCLPAGNIKLNECSKQ